MMLFGIGSVYTGFTEPVGFTDPFAFWALTLTFLVSGTFMVGFQVVKAVRVIASDFMER